MHRITLETMTHFPTLRQFFQKSSAEPIPGQEQKFVPGAPAHKYSTTYQYVNDLAGCGKTQFQISLKERRRKKRRSGQHLAAPPWIYRPSHSPHLLGSLETAMESILKPSELIWRNSLEWDFSNPVRAIGSEGLEKWMATIWKAFPLLALTQGCFMAKIIEFYVPSSFRKKATNWISPEQHGKVIPFGSPQKKSAGPKTTFTCDERILEQPCNQDELRFALNAWIEKEPSSPCRTSKFLSSSTAEC
jgi:hypothetical protein